MTDKTNDDINNDRRVRLEALSQSVIHAINTGNVTVDDILKIADLFEKYIINGADNNKQDKGNANAKN